MSLAAGARLGPYEIVALIGTGGMGEVYKARDTRLNRPVAIKLLPSDHRPDPDRRRRFEREAEAIAALAHPHICVLHDVGQHEGCDFLVMEYLEGETLLSRLKRGRVDIDDVLQFAIQISDALQQAHHQGIIHRDLKPGNIMLTESRVKVLDFGLAKLHRPGEPGTTDRATTDSLTTRGLIVGTLPYMAPEQLECAPVDQRTDIFALGAVLYEMVSGKRAFRGDSRAVQIAAIMHEDPDRWRAATQVCLQAWSVSSTNVSRRIRTHVGRLQRIWRTNCAGSRVARMIMALPSSVGLLRSDGRRSLLPLLVITAVGAVLLRWFVQPDEVHELRQQRVTLTGDVIMSALAPDGRTAALVTGDPGGDNRLLVKEVDGIAGPPIWTDRDILSVAWLPDGSHIAVVGGRERRGVWLVPSVGGTPRRVADSGKMVTSSPDGAALALTENNLLGFTVVSLAHGTTRTVTLTGFHRVVAIEWHARTNRLVLTTADNGDETVWSIWSVSPDGKDRSRLHTSNEFVRAICTSPVSDVVYAIRQRRGSMDLLRVPMYADPGTASVLVTGLPSTLMAYRCSVSADGHRLLYARREALHNLWRLDLEDTTGPGTFLTRGSRDFRFPAVSPDGVWVAATTGSESSPELIKLAIAGGQPMQFGEGIAPVWSSDGQRLAFISRRSGSQRVWTSGTTGQSPQEIKDSAVGGPPLVWLPDGRLAWPTPDRKNYRIRDLFTGRDEFLLTESAAAESIFDLRISPREEHLALGFQQGLWLMSWPDRRWRWQARGLRPIGWSLDSEWIYAISDADAAIVRLSSRTRQTEPIGRFPVGLLPNTCDLAPKSKRIVCGLGEQKSDAWVMIDFDPAVRWTDGFPRTRGDKFRRIDVRG